MGRAERPDHFRAEIEVLEAEALLRVRICGVLDLARMVEIGPRVNAHPDFGPAFGVVYDMADCDVRGISAGDIKKLADLVEGRGLRAGYRVAYVLPSDLAFGLGRMFAGRVEGVRARRRRVVRSWTAALAWMRDTPH